MKKRVFFFFGGPWRLLKIAAEPPFGRLSCPVFRFPLFLLQIGELLSWLVSGTAVLWGTMDVTDTLHGADPYCLDSRVEALAEGSATTTTCYYVPSINFAISFAQRRFGQRQLLHACKQKASKLLFANKLKSRKCSNCSVDIDNCSDADIFGVDLSLFTLYLSYQLVYYYFSVINEIHKNEPLNDIVCQFRRLGFDELVLPKELEDWVAGFGILNYYDKDTGDNFKYKPHLPLFQYDESVGFASCNTKHLLPNFRALLDMMLEPQIFVAKKSPYLNQCIRTNLNRIKMLDNIIHNLDSNKFVKNDKEMVSDLKYTLETVDELINPILKYLCINENLIVNIGKKLEKYYRNIDTFTITDIRGSLYAQSLLILCPIRTVVISNTQDSIHESCVHKYKCISKYDVGHRIFSIACDTPVVWVLDNDLYFTNETIKPFQYKHFTVANYESTEYVDSLQIPDTYRGYGQAACTL